MYKKIDISRVKTYSIKERRNLVKVDDFVSPKDPPPPYNNPELNEIAERIIAARKANRPVIVMIGAHVIKCGLSLLLIDLMKRGFITHIATNGAGSIHDFEIALIGETSEDVATSIEDGSFGMAEETGSIMNEAIQAGVRDGLGYGEALGRIIAEDNRFKFKYYSILYSGYRLRIPVTVHIAMGTDIIHQHPKCNFGALGWATGEDFKIYVNSISQLEGGVFLNIGSAVIGPEVFLKALSIVRNLGYKVEKFTAANFDLIDLGDYRRPISQDHPHYYYRPRKNIINRPTSLGGKGYHITGNHKETIPNLYYMLVKKIPNFAYHRLTEETEIKGETLEEHLEDLETRNFEVAEAVRKLIKKEPRLRIAILDLIRSYRVISLALEGGHTLFLCGNGGSFADALHISAELMKSFKRKRPLPERVRKKLISLKDGQKLVKCLESGLKCITLGTNLSLLSAVLNDFKVPNMNYAQELYVLSQPGDVFFGISTSGNATNVYYAALTAKTLGLTVILLTGESGGKISEIADITIRVPETETYKIQELHVPLYHCLCQMLEACFFHK